MASVVHPLPINKSTWGGGGGGAAPGVSKNATFIDRQEDGGKSHYFLDDCKRGANFFDSQKSAYSLVFFHRQPFLFRSFRR